MATNFNAQMYSSFVKSVGGSDENVSQLIKTAEEALTAALEEEVFQS